MNIIINVIMIVAVVIFFFFLIGIRIVRPTHRGLIETLGKYTGFAQPGFHWVFVFIQRLYLVDIRQAKILEAEGEAQAIKLVNEAAEKYFVGNAQLLRKLQATETALKNNAKIVLPSDSDLVNVIGEMSGVLPLRREPKE